MKNPSVKPEDIERLLSSGRRLTIAHLMSRLGLTHPTALYKLLPKMVADDRVHRALEHADGDSDRKQVVYFTDSSQPVSRPYPAVLLEGTLTGYETTLRDRAALCMMARR